MRVLKTCLFTILCSVSLAAFARVEVYLAYTDHETSGLLRQLAKEKKSPAIVATGVNTITKNQVFGEPPAYYGEYAANHLASGAAAQDPLAQKMGGALQMSLSEHEQKGPPLKSLMMKGARSLSFARPEFSVISVPTESKDKSQNLVVVIQSPEYGRQPALMRRYLSAMFSGISGLPQASPSSGGIQFSSFGTSGGVKKSSNPGDLMDVKASLFVGCEPVPGSAPPKYKARIAFRDLQGRHVEIFESPPQDKLETAQKMAVEKFLALLEDGSKLKCAPSGAVGLASQLAGVAQMMTLNDLVAAQPTSLTVSFFAEKDMKLAAEKLGIVNVNMEDFHVMEAMADAKDFNKKMSSAQVRRIISDPHEISPAAKEELRDWLSTSSYTKDDYVDSLMWGLKGAPMDQMPTKAQWAPFKKLSVDEQRSLLAANTPDPFYYSIAKYMLSDLHNSGALLNSLVSGPRTPEIKKALLAKEAKLRTLVDQIKAPGFANETQARQHLRTIMDELEYLDLPEPAAGKLPLLANSQKGLKVLNFGRDLFESDKSTADQIAKDINYDKLDRTLYRISLIGLDQRAGRYATERARSLRIK